VGAHRIASPIRLAKHRLSRGRRSVAQACAPRSSGRSTPHNRGMRALSRAGPCAPHRSGAARSRRAPASITGIEGASAGAGRAEQPGEAFHRQGADIGPVPVRATRLGAVQQRVPGYITDMGKRKSVLSHRQDLRRFHSIENHALVNGPRNGSVHCL